MPPELLRENRILEPADQACPDCDGNLKPLEEDVSEQLDIVNTAFKVIRHIRRKKACACCERIVQVVAPSRPILHGVAGPGLLAHILVVKFADHHPRCTFHDLHVVHPTPFTTETLRRIDELYGIENQVRGKPPDLRHQIRQEWALPLLVDFEA